MDKEERIKYLVDYLNKTTKAYDEGKPEISDKEWDTLYFELMHLEQETGIILDNSPTQAISYEVVNSLNKVTHNHKMLSLDKTKDWDDFVNYFGNKDVIGMLKMDGLTCSLEYQNGYLVRAETRGNGTVGEDILHNAKVVPTIPNRIDYQDSLVVDGEIICKLNDFQFFSDEYANPRNFASGSIRLLDAAECKKRNLTFVVWNVIKGFDEEHLFLDRLQAVQKLGFTIVPWAFGLDNKTKDILINYAKELNYPIDGLVGRFNDIKYGASLGETDHHSRAAYAFKFYDETYPTILRNIEWTMGRTGQLTPVAQFDPVEIEGSVVSRASLHNLSVLKSILNSDGWNGQHIEVAKMNMIIPQIMSAESPIGGKEYEFFEYPKVCPYCGEETKIELSPTGVENVICANPNCESKLINRLDHFVGKKGLDIKGLSKATLEKLINWGWVNNIHDLFELDQYADEWKAKEGFGAKSVDKILNAIAASKETTFEKFLSALGIPLIGRAVARNLIKEIKTYPELRDKIKSGFDFSVYDGFANSKTEALLNFDYTEADLLYNKYLTIKEIPAEEPTNGGSLVGKTIVVTGSLHIYKNRSELTKAIESAGGKVVGSVSKNTDYLINNDINSTSTKNKRAHELGIPIMTEENFIEKFVLQEKK